MKLFSYLRASILAATIPATCAMAHEFDGGGSGWHSSFPPHVQIIFPEDGTAFLVGDPVDICADVANDFTNPVASVQFFAGTNILGWVTNSMEFSDVYCLTLTNLAAGDYPLTALATDTGGNSVTSSVVDIIVVTNFPPVVHIFAPKNNSVILGPTNIEICASACDPNGTVASVEFCENTNRLGVVPAALRSNTSPINSGCSRSSKPFCLDLEQCPVGAYVLTAVAMDNVGATATSAPVSIIVVTDLPPRVRIESPEKGSTYYAPATVNLSASASDPDGGPVASVAFYAGTNILGVSTTPVLVTNWNHVETIFSLTASNVAAGSYSITAVATDNAGLTSTSSPVKIKVFPPPPPKVIIINPEKGQTFYGAPVNINITSFEWNFTNPVVNVQFFAGTNNVGATTNSPLSNIVWSNAPAGTYKLTALATDSSSLTVTSAPVSITVTTNQPAGHQHGHGHGD